MEGDRQHRMVTRLHVDNTLSGFIVFLDIPLVSNVLN